MKTKIMCALGLHKPKSVLVIVNDEYDGIKCTTATAQTVCAVCGKQIATAIVRPDCANSLPLLGTKK